jgi:hypothetical protein
MRATGAVWSPCLSWCGERCGLVAERLGQLGEISGWIVGAGGDAELLGGDDASGWSVGTEEAVPQEGEQPEVDVADAGPAEVVEAVAAVEGKHAVKAADPVVDVGVLEKQLEGGAGGEGSGDGFRDADQEERGDARDRLYELVGRVLHEPVEAIEAADGVVDSVEAPQQLDPVAGHVHEGHA